MPTLSNPEWSADILTEVRHASSESKIVAILSLCLISWSEALTAELNPDSAQSIISFSTDYQDQPIEHFNQEFVDHVQAVMSNGSIPVVEKIQLIEWILDQADLRYQKEKGSLYASVKTLFRSKVVLTQQLKKPS